MIKVLTAVVNNPVFIEIQYFTLKKYMKCDYEFIVFNDAKKFPDFTNGGDVTIYQQIIDMCSKYGIQCINIPNDSHIQNKDAAIRCADSYNYILKYQLSYPNKYLCIDSDMFLITDFNGDDYLNYDCAIVLQSRNNFQINYMWNGLFYFDTTKMQNLNLLNWSCCPGCDVGGMMQTWLTMQTNTFPNTDEIRHTNKSFHKDGIYYIKHLWSMSWNATEIPANLVNNTELINFFEEDSRNKNGKYFCEIYDNKFLHYRAGGNWNGEGMHLHNYLSNRLRDILCQ